MATSKLTSEFAGWLAPAFKANGFKKKAASWYRTNDETVLVFNIQKSQWGDSFYLNLGVYIRPLGNLETPPHYNCQVRCRLQSLVPDSSRLSELLDFETSMNSSEREAEIVHLVESFAIPWLLSLQYLADVRALVASRPSQAKVQIHIDAFDHFGISYETPS